MKNVFRIFYLVFGLIGLTFCLVAGIFVAESWSFEQRSIPVTGEISRIESYRQSDGDRAHRVFVRYAVDGVVYEERLNSYSSSMREGDAVSLRVIPGQPENVRDGNWLLFPLIFGGIGLAFLIVVLVLWMVQRKKRAGQDRLLTYGVPVTARVQNVQRNGSLHVNGRNPYEVVCAWENPDDGKTYLFRSEMLWFDPEPVLGQRNIKTLTVYVDRDNVKHYYVDIRELADQVVAL